MNPLTKHGARTAVAANGLRKSYRDRIVLDDVDLSIGEGEVFALLGPNGAGLGPARRDRQGAQRGQLKGLRPPGPDTG